MTGYPMCHGCTVPRTSCARLAEVRTAIKGLGVTLVRFRCTEKVYPMKIGDAAWVETNDSLDEERPARAWFPGVLVQISEARPIIFVRPFTEDETGEWSFSPSKEGFVKARWINVRPRPAPAVQVTECSDCASYLNIQKWTCDEEGCTRLPRSNDKETVA